MNIISDILKFKIVAIIRGVKPDHVWQIAEALYAGGIRLIEITINSPKALFVIEEISAQMEGRMLVGAGTVLDGDTARAAIAVGAKFIISPTLDPETIKMTKRYGVISIPGAFTPSEILHAHTMGADIVKVFPARIGADYIRDIRGPLPHIPLMPTGGVSLENIRDFRQAGAVAFGVGSSLVNAAHAVNDQNLSQLTQTARLFVDAISV
ncbi:MAG: bifunctional 4-hydroxy-2-oxoglutarate aldolase/2-dehydro-3-deoxy-phosphogluconate aldolase [Bacteroidetes bacterium]|nr:bifunctional 4-hydroxy-2-oxoglutarate aldolase/2-dehydro-3-deoxy-phosphogluconate aldolase [Bacteroidota bacterium]